MSEKSEQFRRGVETLNAIRDEMSATATMHRKYNDRVDWFRMTARKIQSAVDDILKAKEEDDGAV